MNISRRRFITIVAGASLAATTAPSFAKPVSWRGVVLGADAKLVISGMTQSDAKRLINLAVEEANRLENIFSLYRSQSVISRLNKAEILKNPPLELLTLLSTIDLIHEASDGYFDPTIQPIWESYAEHAGHPPRKLIEQKQELVGWQNVSFSSQSVQFEKQGMAMTFNGIAQGFITDRIVQLLKNEGLQNAIVKMGEISAIGRNELGKAWDIGIANSGDDAADQMVHLTNQSIASSSADATTFDGIVGHILNPKQGVTIQNLWQRVSVVHKSAAMADGVSTAAVLMSEDQIVRMLKNIKGTQVLAKYHDGRDYAHHS